MTAPYHAPDCGGSCDGCGWIDKDGVWHAGPTPGSEAPHQQARAEDWTTADVFRAVIDLWPDHQTHILCATVRRSLMSAAADHDGTPAGDELRAEAEEWPDTCSTVTWSTVRAALGIRLRRIEAKS